MTDSVIISNIGILGITVSLVKCLTLSGFVPFARKSAMRDTTYLTLNFLLSFVTVARKNKALGFEKYLCPKKDYCHGIVIL